VKLFPVSQIKECEEITLLQQKISSLALMEQAAAACCEWIKDNFKNKQAFLVLCGMGNNGGDGLALTRLLLQEGFSAKAIVLKHAEKFAENTSENLKLLHQLSPPNIEIVEEGHFVTELPKDVIVVDALFGIGLNRPLSGWMSEFISEINYLPNTKIALDISSGLPMDSVPDLSPDAQTAIFKADFTLSFQFYKRVFLHQETTIFSGKIIVLDIGLSENYSNTTPSQFQVIDEMKIREIHKIRSPFSHKGSFKNTHLIGGSFGKTGAIALSALGALKAGAAKVFIHAPSCGYPAIQSFIPEAMFASSGTSFVEEIELPDKNDIVAIGPGLGKNEKTQNAFKTFLEKQTAPLIIDADALNIISEHAEMMHQIPHNSILTPHPKEFSRLFGDTENSMAQVELARHNAMKFNIFIVLKNHFTFIATPDGSGWYNITGNAGMATGGSGDVLTGILAGLLSQGYTSLETALLGVYLHGLAGDIFAAENAQESLIARDLANYLGKAFSKINKKNIDSVK